VFVTAIRVFTDRRCVLSSQTAMGVGILLLTVYGKEIEFGRKVCLEAMEALKEIGRKVIKKDFALIKLAVEKTQTDIIEFKESIWQ
jgi:hypothetical protein